MSSLEISLVLCTHNPREDFLKTCLGSVAAQTFEQGRFEFIVVDNCSNPPLDRTKLEQLAGRPVKLVREARPGLAYARVAGFETAQTDLIAFIDDDNEFFPDYLSNAVRIAAREPALGVFGGRCFGALERPVGSIKQPFLPFLGVRDAGEIPLTGEGNEWGLHEPIGAGIVVRRPVATAYTRYLNENAGGGSLGRSGKQLLSGEDSLLSRLAHRCGFKCGYRPELKLRHHIEARRTTWGYLFRLMRGHGVSYVRLGRISGAKFEAVEQAVAQRTIRKNFFYRMSKDGVVNAIMHVPWDQGFYEASNEAADANAKSLDEVFGKSGAGPAPHQAPEPDEQGARFHAVASFVLAAAQAALVFGGNWPHF